MSENQKWKTINGQEYQNLNDFLSHGLDAFLLKEFEISIPLEEYFTYHPPTSQERRNLHVKANASALDGCLSLIEVLKEIDDSQYEAKRSEIIERLIGIAIDVCKDETCLQWAIKSLLAIKGKETDILMRIQQWRMFVNQGITVDEIKSIDDLVAQKNSIESKKRRIQENG